MEMTMRLWSSVPDNFNFAAGRMNVTHDYLVDILGANEISDHQKGYVLFR